MEHGTIVATVGGEVVDDLSKIPGGSKVELQARADRGWHFDYWVIDGEKLNDETKAKTDGVYTFEALEKGHSVQAVFAQSKSYKANASADADGTTVTYTLYDIYGDVVETKDMPANGITIYENEKILFSVAEPDGFMVEKWMLNDADYTSNEFDPDAEHVAIGPILADKNLTVKVILATTEHYKVSYPSNVVNGKLTAAADKDITELVPKGTKITFTATPNDKKMIEKWTVIKGSTTTDVKADDVDFVDPIYIHTLNGDSEINVIFTDLVQYDAKISGSNGSGKFTYTTPIQPSDNGAIDTKNTKVRKNGTVKLTLTPIENCVGTAEEIKTELQKTYTFTMPESDVTVTATFAAKPSSGGGIGGGGGAGGGGAVAPAPSDNGSSAITAPDGTKVPATVTVKDGTAAVSADSSKLTAVSGKDSLTLDLSADSTVRTVSLTGDVVTALASAKNGVSITLPNGTVRSTARR